MRLLGKALTFDDVLLVPAFSQVLPRDTSLATSLSRNIRLNLPLVSAAMDTVTEARLAIAIAQEGGIGIVTNRDLRFESRLDVPVREIMTPRERLITVGEGATLDQAKALMHKHKLERVLVVNSAFELRGLMTVKDITKQTSFPNAARDAHGKLRVGAAVGVGEGTEERV